MVLEKTVTELFLIPGINLSHFYHISFTVSLTVRRKKYIINKDIQIAVKEQKEE